MDLGFAEQGGQGASLAPASGGDPLRERPAVCERCNKEGESGLSVSCFQFLPGKVSYFTHPHPHPLPHSWNV